MCHLHIRGWHDEMVDGARYLPAKRAVHQKVSRVEKNSSRRESNCDLEPIGRDCEVGQYCALAEQRTTCVERLDGSTEIAGDENLKEVIRGTMRQMRGLNREFHAYEGKDQVGMNSVYFNNISFMASWLGVAPTNTSHLLACSDDILASVIQEVINISQSSHRSIERFVRPGYIEIAIRHYDIAITIAK
jgi:hypothetical protein